MQPVKSPISFSHLLLGIQIIAGVVAFAPIPSFAADVNQLVYRDVITSGSSLGNPAASLNHYQVEFKKLNVKPLTGFLSAEEQEEILPSAKRLWNRNYYLHHLQKELSEAQGPQQVAEVTNAIINQKKLVLRAVAAYISRVDAISMNRTATGLARLNSFEVKTPEVLVAVQGPASGSAKKNSALTDSADFANSTQDSSDGGDLADENRNANTTCADCGRISSSNVSSTAHLPTLVAKVVHTLVNDQEKQLDKNEAISDTAKVSDPILNSTARTPSNDPKSFSAPACAIPVGSNKTYLTQFTTQHYRLNRGPDEDGKPVFTATVNLHFVIDRTHLSAGDSPQAAQMQARVDQCYKTLGDIEGPNGEKLRISRAVGSDQLSIPANTVAITPMAREDDMDWNKDVECATIVHETLHHLGLVDLYNEKDDKISQRRVTEADGSTTSDYDCRKPGPVDSVMAYPDLAAAETYGYQTRLNCNCETDNFHECSVQLKTISGVPDSCPAGTGQGSGSLYTVPGQPVSHALDVNPLNLSNTDSFASSAVADEKTRGIYNQGHLTANYRYEGTKQNPPTRRSILFPAEFRLIAYPDCVQENSVYRSCASEAYKSSQTGQGCTPPSQLAPECSDANLWME